MAASLIATMVSSLMQFVASSLINVVFGKGGTTAVKGQEGGILPLTALPLIIKVQGKGVQRARRGCMDKYFWFCSILQAISRLLKFNGVFSRDNLLRIKDVANVINLMAKKGK